MLLAACSEKGGAQRGGCSIHFVPSSELFATTETGPQPSWRDGRSCAAPGCQCLPPSADPRVMPANLLPRESFVETHAKRPVKSYIPPDPSFISPLIFLPLSLSICLYKERVLGWSMVFLSLKPRVPYEPRVTIAWFLLDSRTKSLHRRLRTTRGGEPVKMRRQLATRTKSKGCVRYH